MKRLTVIDIATQALNEAGRRVYGFEEPSEEVQINVLCQAYENGTLATYRRHQTFNGQMNEAIKLFDI